MGKGGSAKQQVNEYNLSMHFGVCAQMDAITAIYIGEKTAWMGRLASEGAIPVQNEYLFGGPKKEGGVRGIAYYLPGAKTQKLPDGLAARRGLTSNTHPAYRGLASVYFVGSMSPGLGFYWGATPYLQSVWITGERAPKGLSPAFALIGNGADANPAHIIYECLTNTTWGMGANDGLVDRENMEAVGRVLYDEGFGMSLQWTRESSIEQFIGEVLDHIQAAIYVDPETGKLTLKLFRDDYDATTLPLITPDNAVLDNYQRKLWGETVNEILATWTNPVNEQEETVTQQDLGNITVQGATISDSRNYYGVRNSELATRLATRDVRQSSAPLASVEALLDRSQWNLKPGSVVRLTWPEYNIVNLVMRVTVIDYGKIGSPSITVSLLEDIFSLEKADYSVAPSTGFVSGAQAPTPMDHVRVITAPAYFSSRYLSAADTAALTYPDVLTAVLGACSNPDASFYNTVGVSTLPNGAAAAEVRSTHGLLSYTTLASPLAEEAFTTVASFTSGTPGIGPNVAGFLFIGDTGERRMEIALIESFDANGWHLARGVLDTVPRAWPAGTAVWFYDVRNTFMDDEEHSDGEAVSFKFLTVTSLGVLDPAAAPIQGATLTGRPYYPNRPANVVIAGRAFGTVDLSASPPTTVPVTWANRNRTMEDGAVLRWTDANVVPEVGQTTTIKLTKTADGSVITTIDGITGTSYDLPASAFAGQFQADVTITAKRDSYESLMGVTRRVRIAPDPNNPGTPPGDPTPPADTGGGYTPPTNYPQPQQPPRYCVEATAKVLLAREDRRGSGIAIRASDLKPGAWLWTRDEHDTAVWGAHQVASVELVRQPVLRAAGFPRATADHRFWTGASWTRMEEIGQPDGETLVARIAVYGAHTYVTVEAGGALILSHNLKQNEQVDD
jgi:hypothetical protein